MKVRGSIFPCLTLSLITALALLTPAIASAQDETPKALPALLAGGFLMFALVISLAMYVYVALALSTIAQKTGTENGWLAWIPIANIILMLNIARKPVWWILLCLIPLVNIVIFIIVWMGIAEARNKPNWWGVLMIVPIVSIIVPGYLAWSD